MTIISTNFDLSFNRDLLKGKKKKNDPDGIGRGENPRGERFGIIPFARRNKRAGR